MKIKHIVLCLFMLFPIVSHAQLEVVNGQLTTQSIFWLAATKASEFGIDPKVAIYIIQMESHANPKALHKNDGAIGCDSRGLVQIRDCSHLDVSDKEAYDPIFAIQWLVENLAKGLCKMWSTCPIDST